ncbi:hypothetical protein FRB91_000207 [Serendipita sp. 411]|nr:hypothetical protein FRB91_000207 [Serendipita sp. 411]
MSNQAPQAESVSRKRSRSPEEGDEKSSLLPTTKRQNTGLASSGSSGILDVAMSEAQDVKTNIANNNIISHASSVDLEKPKDLPAKPDISTTNDKPSSGATTAAPHVPTIHMRCLIVTQDASIIIGKGGSHVNEIREKSGAKVMVSESIPGNPERILNVSGPLDAVSKAFGLIVRRINDEPPGPSVPGSRAVTIKFIIPHSRMGSVIGKGGAKIKEIQEASGARLNASEGMLPGSTERILSVTGVADAVHIATYYVGNILIQQQEAHGVVGTSYRQSRGPRAFNEVSAPTGGGQGQQYYPGHYQQQQQPQQPQQHMMPQAAAPSGPLQTQQIYIPNDLVGCIIGKGGSKINEIRQSSQSQIKIMEPGAVGVGVGGQQAGPPNEGERLVVITGAPHNIQLAVGMLYHVSLLYSCLLNG